MTRTKFLLLSFVVTVLATVLALAASARDLDQKQNHLAVAIRKELLGRPLQAGEIPVARAELTNAIDRAVAGRSTRCRKRCCRAGRRRSDSDRGEPSAYATGGHRRRVVGWRCDIVVDLRGGGRDRSCRRRTVELDQRSSRGHPKQPRKLLGHPGIADALIARHGDEAVGALNRISQKSAQRLGMVSDEGLPSATQRSPELLGVIHKYGDPAMDFIWTNKGALTVATLLTRFLADPEAYFSGIKSLADTGLERVVEPMVKSVNWTLIVSAVLFVALLPLIVRSARRARSEWRPRQDHRT